MSILLPTSRLSLLALQITAISFFSLIILVIASTASAHDHYTFEHAEEMRTSGRIEWQEYGPDAFTDAITQNKPLFLVLTAPSWCYWCHVYTSDDYIYHEDIYPIINEQFIPIYVDADKRQDLTREFLEGGWPSTTVMAPNGDRLYGHSGPRPLTNISANLLDAVRHVETQGFANSVSYEYVERDVKVPTATDLEHTISLYDQFARTQFDPLHGGFGQGQKFPQARALDFFLDRYEETNDEWYINAVEKTLSEQYTAVADIESNYNLYDPIEGGFHRYGTARNWTPPHYEKMLYDNARLLKAYSHLKELRPENTIAQEVVSGTDNYMQRDWRDWSAGGFYGNTDVHGEDAYFGQNPRPADKPRIEKTKYTDWNSEAILTYLSLWERTGNQEYKTIATEALVFMMSEMMDDSGAYHYKQDDGERGVRGLLLDNAYLLLALTEAAHVLGDDVYTQRAEELATYILGNLYDWHTGGFFERNSPDLDLYAPGEHIALSKPVEENGIAAYAMLRLSQLTTNDTSTLYLNAGIKTLGMLILSIGGSDNDYYIMQSARYAERESLLTTYANATTDIASAESLARTDFWLDALVIDNDAESAAFVMSEDGLEKLDGPFAILLLIALIAGFLSFISPCTLPVLPAFVAYTFRSGGKSLARMTFAFFCGLALVFVALGMSASFIGAFLRDHLTLFSQVAGIGLIFFGLYIISGRGFSGLSMQGKKSPTTYLGSFAFGGILGLSWTPCIGPILVAILLLASTTGSSVLGGLLLFAYAIGLAVPLVALAFTADRFSQKTRFWKILAGKEISFNILDKKFSAHSSALISGIIFLILGYVIFTGTLYTLNELVGTSGFQKWIFSLEDKLLHIIK